jgi:hypothetical protein
MLKNDATDKIVPLSGLFPWSFYHLKGGWLKVKDKYLELVGMR